MTHPEEPISISQIPHPEERIPISQTHRGRQANKVITDELEKQFLTEVSIIVTVGVGIIALLLLILYRLHHREYPWGP